MDKLFAPCLYIVLTFLPPKKGQPIPSLYKGKRFNIAFCSSVDTWHNLVSLDLSHNMITALHVSTQAHTHTHTIFALSSSLQPNICKCSKLKRLFLSGKYMCHSLIPSLKQLCCYNPPPSLLLLLPLPIDNRLNFEGIPAGIGKLTNLEHFVAARNKLECVPEGLCHCYSLRSLVLTSNCLLTLPEAIHFLKLEVCP